MVYGHRKAPPWTVLIEFAQESNTTPWKLFGGSKTLWFARWEALREARYKKIHKMEAAAKAKALK